MNFSTPKERLNPQQQINLNLPNLVICNNIKYNKRLGWIAHIVKICHFNNHFTITAVSYGLLFLNINNISGIFEDLVLMIIFTVNSLYSSIKILDGIGKL